MEKSEKIAIVAAEVVEPAQLSLVHSQRGRAEAAQRFIVDAVALALDAREAKAAEERAESESTPESRARAWSVQAANTRTGYSGDWQRFVEWCEKREEFVGIPSELQTLDPIEHASQIEAAFVPASPSLVVQYLLDMDKRGRAISTIGRAASAIGRTHARYGAKVPTRSERVRDELSYLRKKQKHKPKRARALELEKFLRIMETFEPRATLRQKRDAALASVWFNFGLRRIEIHKLRTEHVSIEWNAKVREQVLTVLIHESKTDQEGKGESLAVGVRENEKLCALRAVESWLAATELDESAPLFPTMRGETVTGEPMTLRALDLWIKRVAKRAQLDGSFSTHSVRAGCATSLYSLSVNETAIRNHLRHKSATTTRVYDRPSNQVTRDPFRKKL